MPDPGERAKAACAESKQASRTGRASVDCASESVGCVDRLAAHELAGIIWSLGGTGRTDAS